MISKKLAIITLGVSMGLSGCGNKSIKDVQTAETEYINSKATDTLAVVSNTQDSSNLINVDSIESKGQADSKIEANIIEESTPDIPKEDKEEDKEETFDNALKKCNDFLRNQKYYFTTDTIFTEITVTKLGTDSLEDELKSKRNSNRSVKSYRNLEDNEMSVDIISEDSIDGEVQAESSESAIVKFDAQAGKYKVWLRDYGESNIWNENYSDRIPEDLKEYERITIDGGKIVDKSIDNIGSIYVLAGKISPEIELNGSLSGCKLEDTSLAEISIYLDSNYRPVRMEIHGKNMPVSSNSASYSVEITEYSKAIKYDSFEQIVLNTPYDMDSTQLDEIQYNKDGTEDLSKSLLGLKLKDAELKGFVLATSDYDNKLEPNSSSTTFVYITQGELNEAYSIILENNTNDYAYAINCNIVDASYAERLTEESKIFEKFHKNKEGD